MYFKQTADSDIVSFYQVSYVQLETDKKLEALNRSKLRPSYLTFRLLVFEPIILQRSRNLCFYLCPSISNIVALWFVSFL